VRQRLSERAIGECLTELHAACRRPVDAEAVAQLVESLRAAFEGILDNPDGRVRWAEHGYLMRNNGRHIGSLADFLANAANVDNVNRTHLLSAFDLVRTACRVGANAAVGTPDATDMREAIQQKAANLNS
jgi:hypothetical protein